MSRRLKLLLLGCGDIAERLACQLSESHYDITGLRRTPKPDSRFPVLAGDACDLHCMNGLMQIGFDTIVVTITPSERTEAGYRNSYYQTMVTLLQAIADSRIQPLVLFVSSTSVYGQNSGEWLDERSPTEPAGFKGRILLETEQLIRNSGIANSVVRFSGIYGPGRTGLLKPVLSGAPLTRPFGWTNRIHSEDCAGVLAHLLEKHRDGQLLEPLYLASDNEPVMQWQLREFLSERLGVEARHSRQSEFEESGKRCSNRILKESGYRWRFPDYRSGYTALIEQPNRSTEES